MIVHIYNSGMGKLCHKGRKHPFPSAGGGERD